MHPHSDEAKAAVRALLDVEPDGPSAITGVAFVTRIDGMDVIVSIVPIN